MVRDKVEVYHVALPVVEEDALEEGGDGADGVVPGADESNVDHVVLNGVASVMKGSLIITM